MVLTRSASCSPAKQKAAPVIQTASKQREPAALPTVEPLRLVIAPKSISQFARFVLLPGPTDQKPRQFFFCPDAGLFELTQVSLPKHDPRSILFAPVDHAGSVAPIDGSIGFGYVNKNAQYMVATPYDMSFMLLPVVAENGRSKLFQTADDLLDAGFDEGYDLKYITPRSTAAVATSLSAICDIIEAGDEVLYRYNQSKTLQLMINKAKKAAQNGLPSSLEDRFVTRVLETPILSVKREESTVSLSRTNSAPQSAREGTNTSQPGESLDSQSSAASAAPSVIFSEASITTESTETANLSDGNPSEDIRNLQRLATAFKFITASYTSPKLSAELSSLLYSSVSGVDFGPLDAHLAYLAKLRSDATASTDMSSFSRKRGTLEDEEEAEMRADKKRRLDEDEKRKRANTSHGVKALAKVNTAGMKKMSSFFAPKGAKGKG